MFFFSKRDDRPKSTKKGRRANATEQRARLSRTSLRLEALEERALMTMAPVVSIAAGTTPTAVQIADFDGDGRADIAALNSSVGAVSVSLGNGDGTFQAAINSADGGFGSKMNVADYNGDGKLDVAVSHGGAIDILMGRGDGNFDLPVAYYVGASANDIETGDFDHDGHPDIVTASFGYGGTSQLLLNSGTGTFLPTRNLAISSFGQQVEVADLNNDGNLDLIEGNGTTYVGVLMGRGDGTFQSTASLNMGTATRAMAVGDFNKDGTTDLAVTSGSTLSLYVGNGNGTFQPPTNYQVAAATDLSIADLNGDGLLDVALNNGQVAFGRGDGTLYAPTSFGGAAIGKIAVGDLNNDGSADMVSAAPSGVGSGLGVSLNANNDAALLGGAVGLVVSTPSSVTAGTPFGVTVSAVDANGNVIPGFLGTVAVSGTAGAQPTSYTFAAADAGTHTIPGSAMLFRAGLQSVSVTTPFLPVATGTVSVTAALAAKFSITADATAIAGQPTSFTVTAQDAYGNLAQDYAGTLHFRSSDLQAALPADYTFSAGDAGIHTFSATLKTAGLQTIGAAELANAAMTANSTSVSVAPVAAVSLSLAGGGGFVGSANAVTIVARDMYGNIATGYGGLVHLASSGLQTVVSADAALVGGVGTFTVNSSVVGPQTLTAVDLVNGLIAGSENIVFTPGWGVRFVATPLAASVAGQTQSTMITAYDSFGNVSTVYTGTLRVTTSDPRAPLAYYTFTAADAGVKTIPVALYTSGVQSVTISDSVNPAVTFTQAGISVTPAAASYLAVTALHASVAGVAQPVVVTVRDVYGNLATAYRGTLSFSSSDTQAALPAAYTFTAADGGLHTFSVTLKSSGGQSLTVSDAAHAGNLAFTSFQRDVPVTPAAVAGLSFRAPSNATAGVAFSISVSAVDAFGNTVAGYTGKVHFSGPSGGGNLLPADYTFTSADAGVHTFLVTLSSTGTQTIGIADTVNGSIKGSTSVKVVSGTVSSGGGTATGGTATGGGGAAKGGGKVIVP